MHIVGTNDLSASVAAGIRGLPAARMEDFAGRLVELTNDMRTSNGRNRDAVLALLSDGQVQFALEIAKPWYLGCVGSPSDFVLGDDAAFATFPEAQSWQKIILEFPRITYPGWSAGWWDTAPPNVEAPPMPAEITDWTFQPGGPSTIMPHDAVWKAYATAKHEASSLRGVPSRAVSRRQSETVKARDLFGHD